MQKDELEYQTKLTELERLRSDIRKEFSQDRHREKQETHWDRLTIIAVIAVLINGLKPFWENLAKYLFNQ